MKTLLAAICSLGLILSSPLCFASGQWTEDFDKAKQESAATGRPILADFTGSDWCIWCKKLDGEVFSQPAFQAYAKDNLVLFMADFPRGKKLDAKVSEQNNTLLQQYGVQGFPTVLLLDKTGAVIAQTGYVPGGAEKYVEHLKKLLKK